MTNCLLYHPGWAILGKFSSKGFPHLLTTTSRPTRILEVVGEFALNIQAQMDLDFPKFAQVNDLEFLLDSKGEKCQILPSLWATDLSF